MDRDHRQSTSPLFLVLSNLTLLLRHCHCFQPALNPLLSQNDASFRSSGEDLEIWDFVDFSDVNWFHPGADGFPRELLPSAVLVISWLQLLVTDGKSFNNDLKKSRKIRDRFSSIC